MSNTTGQLNFNYFKISSIEVDISKIKSLEIFESIEFPGNVGNVVIDDWVTLKEKLNIFSGDIVDISFGRDSDPVLVLEMVITDDPVEIILPGQDDKYIQLSFCSKWLVEGFTQNRSKVWKNKYIHEIVADLVEDCGGTLGAFERTKQKLDRFVSPFWSPIQTIRYLMGFAVDRNDHGGYLLFSDLREDNVNFLPYNRLIHAEINAGRVPFNLKFNPKHALSYEKILNLSVANSYDSIKYGNSGLGRSQYIGFDYDKTEMMKNDLRIDEYIHNHLSTVLPLNNKYLGDKYRTSKEMLLYPNTDSLITDDVIESEEYLRSPSELLNGKMNTKQSLTFSDMVTLNIVTNGEGVHKKSGRLIGVEIPSRNRKIEVLHKQLSGTYLIKNLKHSIVDLIYSNTMTVISDGYKLVSRKDMITWSEENYTDDENWFVGSNG